MVPWFQGFQGGRLRCMKPSSIYQLLLSFVTVWKVPPVVTLNEANE